MSERESYEHGIPSWVDHSSPDPEGAAHFYGALLGWETEDQMPPDQPGQYFMCRLRGRDVAATGSQQAPDAPPMWNTYIAVDSADDAAAAIRDAGGTVLGEPFDVFDAGRMAVALDPEGTPFCIWQAQRTPGAGIVNEPGALCWTELTARDPDTAKAFYGSVFGWRSGPMAPDDPYTLWYAAGGGDPGGDDPPIGGLMPLGGDPSGQPPNWGVCFAVADTDATAASCTELGGGTIMAPFDTPVGRTAVLADPQGAGFAVIALSDPGQ
jgi:predicted enzyme related to lactoylglutathione lyase